MTTRIENRVVQVVAAPSGCLLLMIDGKLRRDRFFIFQSAAIRAAKEEISKQTK